MTNEILEQFRQLDSSYLLHIAAFELQDYSQEAQGLLRTALFERGIDEAQIKAYRLAKFPFPTMDVDCEKCGEHLTIERQELNEGTFTCPECGTSQAVPYPEISIDDEVHSITGRQLDLKASLANDPEEPAATELVNDPLAKLYGYGDSVPKIAPGDRPEVEEVRLLGEGLPDTVCAKCGIVLEPEHTFLSDDDFYCEKCYNEIPQMEAVTEEEEDDS